MRILTWLRISAETMRYWLAQVTPEWSENWHAWPHCNGQAGCWMHVRHPWCKCRCRWCQIARRVRPRLPNGANL